MNRQKRMLLIVAALTMFLGACASGTPLGISEPKTPAEARKAIAPACPTPTPASKLKSIERELEAGLKAGAALDVLASEWERLDAGSRVCRGET